MEIKYEKLISESAAPYFTRQNLVILLGNNRRTLDYRIKTLIAKGMLTRIKSGTYINATLLTTTNSPEELLRYVGCQLVPNSYVSLKYALSLYGILAESVYAITLITTKKTRQFSNGALRFLYQTIQPALFTGFVEKSYMNFSYRMATPAKALFDFLYLTPLSSKSAMEEFVTNTRLNWNVLTKADKKEFNEYILRSESIKLNTFCIMLTKKGML